MKHAPIRPARAGEEEVFARRWVELMEAPPSDKWSTKMLHRIMIGFPYEINQRVASVCASMVVWFGTNVGKSFLDIGEKIAKYGTIRYPYLAAWGEANARSFGMNSGARQIEFLLRTSDELNRDVFGIVTVSDVEAIEQLCMWLGSQDGRVFLAGCEKEVERRKELETLAFHCAAGRADTPAVRKLIDKFAIHR